MADDSNLKSTSITSGGKEYLPHAASLLSKAFETDPVLTYMLCSMSDEERIGYLPTYFTALLTAASMNQAIFDEVEGWKSCGVLMPPECRVDNPWTLLPAGFIPMLWKIGFGGCKRMLAEFTPLADAAKAKGLKGEKRYYYVFFIGTKEDERGHGYAGSLIRRWQEMATRDQLPVWLEATTAHSMKIYQNLGFEIVDKMILGGGKVDDQGQPSKGGGGVPIWGMIWRPDIVKSLKPSS